jgi:tetratricopeptide (TPR) repeat protein
MTTYEPPTALPPHVLDRSDVRAAIAAHDFGTVFLLARKWAAISYSKIAVECDIKPERVGALARGEGRITTYEKIVKVADAMRIPGCLLGLADRPWENGAHASQTSGVPMRTVDQHGGDQVLRREFMRVSAAGTGLVFGLSNQTRMNLRGKIGRDVPEQLRRRTARLRRLDDFLGGGDTYNVYLGEYRATKRILKEGGYAEETRLALLSVLAEQAQQAGWSAFDAGKQVDATGLYAASREAAVEANDLSLAGNALAFLAYQQANGDRKAGVDISTESCRTAGRDAPSTVRALLYERLAWTHALAGNAPETQHALSTAEAALSEGEATPQPDWAAWVDRNELQIMTGRCWTELRRPLRAVPVLQDVLTRYDDSHARDKALYLSWLADAYLAAGEIEEAATVAGRCLDLSGGVASVRPRQRLAPVLRRMSAHKSLQAVAELMERAAA